ncbi:MAG: hypothetical protein GX601_17060 [Anaerolineales bacterium]|nr:hypothetical protein [Anaerolineales bacterium]
MKVAVASMGTVPEALVGVRFGMCSQFLVFDLDTMEYVVVSVPSQERQRDRVSLAAIRAVAGQSVAAVITGHIKDICRQTLLDLGIEVVDGVEGMTVREAIERYRVSGLAERETRKGFITRVAVVTSGEGLEARLEDPLGVCASFVVVDPATKDCEAVRVARRATAREVSMSGIRAVVESGAGVLITPAIHPECCLALQALAVSVYLAPVGITVRHVLERYESGQLQQVEYGF